MQLLLLNLTLNLHINAIYHLSFNVWLMSSNKNLRRFAQTLSETAWWWMRVYYHETSERLDASAHQYCCGCYKQSMFFLKSYLY